jgi:hypothetical protein
MKVEVIVAIISGLCALVASVQAVRTNIAVEKMKETTARRQKAFEIASSESAPVETALAQAWRDIQLIKEIISSLTSRARYDVDIALADLAPPCSSLMEGYAKWGASIPEQARKPWHTAKGTVASVQMMLREHGTNKSELPSDVIEALKETRTFLSDHQTAIGDARQSVRDSRIEHLLTLI